MVLWATAAMASVSARPRALSLDINHQIEVRQENDWTPLFGGCVTLRADEALPAFFRQPAQRIAGRSTPLGFVGDHDQAIIELGNEGSMALSG